MRDTERQGVRCRTPWRLVYSESSDNRNRGDKKKRILKRILFERAEDGAQTRDPQLGRLMLYQLSYFRNLSGQRWIRTTEGVSQQIYSLPHLATLVFAQRTN